MTNEYDALDIPYPKGDIDKEESVSYAGRYHIGSSRIAAGYVLSREEYEEYRSKVYSVPLP
jgi:hypothetical protein